MKFGRPVRSKFEASARKIRDVTVCGGNAAGAREGASVANIASFLNLARGTAKFVEGGVEIGDHVINVWRGPL